ncbi:MAG: DUF805 domain-containing protein [Rhodobacteraceae bacterium]|nr:DUF805 domain-containing protein [Paracoccaceae bacterium]
MTILDATRICLRKAFVFQGRATRAEFWWFSGAVVLAFAAALGLDRLLFPVAMMRGMLPVSAGLFALTAIPMLSAAGGGCRMSVGRGTRCCCRCWPIWALSRRCGWCRRCSLRFCASASMTRGFTMR